MSACIHAPCPKCGDDLGQGYALMGDAVPAARDPEGLARLEIVVRCDGCQTEFASFVPVSSLVEVKE